MLRVGCSGRSVTGACTPARNPSVADHIREAFFPSARDLFGARGPSRVGPLGVREQPGLSALGLACGGGPHSTFCLEFGAGGSFGWIVRLVDAQYESPERTDSSARMPVPSRPSRASDIDFGQCRSSHDSGSRKVPTTKRRRSAMPTDLREKRSRSGGGGGGGADLKDHCQRSNL